MISANYQNLKTFSLFLKIVAIILLSGSSTVNSSNCLPNMEKINLQEGNSTYSNFVMASGLNFGNLGDFERCTNFLGEKYFLATLNVGLPTYIGLCLPKECNETELNGAKSSIVNIIKKYTQIEIDPNLLYILDVQLRYDQRKDQFNTGLIITFIVISIIVLLYLVQWIFFPNRKRNNKNQITVSTSNLDEITKIQSTDNNLESARYPDRTVFSSTERLVVNVPSDSELSNKQEGETSKPSGLKMFLSNFDIVTNVGKILRVKSANDDPLKIFDGIRFFSAGYVVFGHAFFMLLLLGLYNPEEMLHTVITLKGSIVYSGFFAVDVFFYMSGFMMYKGMQKYFTEADDQSAETVKRRLSFKKKIFLILNGFVMRYIRLLPLYLFIILGMTSIVTLFPSGPLSLSNFMNASCPDYWWHNLLYINNVVNYEAMGNQTGMCAGHSWYLANDMQFFILFLMIFVLLSNQRKARNILIGCIMVVSLIISYFVCINKKYRYNDMAHPTSSSATFFNDYYIKPYIRISPYILGLYFCEFYLECEAYPKYKPNDKDNSFRKINRFFKNSTTASVILFVFALILINFAVFSTYLTNNYDLDMWVHATFQTLNKNLFVIGLGLIVHLTFLGQMRIIYNILNQKIFNVIAKITYGTYLIHLYIFLGILTSYPQAIYFKFSNMLMLSLGVFIFALISAFVLSILFESPVISMMKNYLSKKKENSD